MGLLIMPTPPTPGRLTPTPATTTPLTVAAVASPTNAGVICSPGDSEPVHRVRPGKANSIHLPTSLNEQEQHRAVAEDPSTVDKYGSIQSSPAPSHIGVGPRPITPQPLGTATLPHLSYHGPGGMGMPSDGHAGSPGAISGGPPLNPHGGPSCALVTP